VSGFVRRYTGENNAGQYQIARSVGVALMRSVVGLEDEQGKKKERQVQTHVYPEQASDRNRPASHGC